MKDSQNFRPSYNTARCGLTNERDIQRIKFSLPIDADHILSYRVSYMSNLILLNRLGDE